MSPPRVPVLEPRLPVAGESLCCARERLESGPLDWHRHSGFELRLIESGAGELRVEDYNGRFSAGQVVLIGPKQAHGWRTLAGTADTRVIYFEPNLLLRAVEVFAELRPVQCWLNRAVYGLRLEPQSGAEVASAFCRLERTEGCQRIAALFDLLGLLYKAGEGTRLAHRDGLSPVVGCSERINCALDYIALHYGRDLPLIEVAEVMDMSSAYFCRWFKQQAGISFSNYLHQLRVTEACHLLIGNELSVSEISCTVGYNNLSSFNRRFQQFKGTTPLAYRRRHLVSGGI